MKLLFINTKKERCGVHQYGTTLYELLKASEKFECFYDTPSTIAEVQELQKKESFDIIMVNYHKDITTGAFNPSFPKQFEAKTICVVHDMFQIGHLGGLYDALIYGDPTLQDNDINKIYGYGRILCDYESKHVEDGILRVGSFGFNNSQKNYASIVEMVQHTHDNAEININIPPNNSVSSETPEAIEATQYVRAIRAAVRKPGIKLNITHDFLDYKETVDRLAANTINIFPFTQVMPGSGISSSLDIAISCKRPFAISDCILFRHVLGYNLPVRLDQYSIDEIIANGTKVLQPLYDDWSRAKTLARLEDIVINK